MPKTLPLVRETIGQPDRPEPAVTSPAAGEMEILNDEVLIETAPDRPRRDDPA